jgi:hypothetical protein
METTTKKGGVRAGAGRKKGIPNKKTADVQAKVAASGVTPLEYMLSQMRKPYPRRASVAQKIAMDNMRFEAAKAAAPYVHAKLASIEHSGKGGGPLLVSISQEDEDL